VVYTYCLDLSLGWRVLLVEEQLFIAVVQFIPVLFFGGFYLLRVLLLSTWKSCCFVLAIFSFF
jgi:hypothetical protein